MPTFSFDDVHQPPCPSASPPAGRITGTARRFGGTGKVHRLRFVDANDGREVGGTDVDLTESRRASVDCAHDGETGLRWLKVVWDDDAPTPEQQVCLK